MSVTMMVDLLGTAHAAKVLASLERIGGKARFTPLREAAGIGDQQLSRAIRFLNRQGLVSCKVLAEGERAPIEYHLSKLGQQALDVLRLWHDAVHGRRTHVAQLAHDELAGIVGE